MSHSGGRRGEGRELEVQRRKARIVEARRGRRREMYRMERSVEERTSRCGRREQDM